MKEPLGKWAIELKAEQKMIGLIQFSKLIEQKGTAELSYVLHKKYWNQGLMTETLASLTEVGLREIGLKQLVLHCDRENFSSIQVAQKVGYKCIGRFKGSTQYNKGRISVFEEYVIKKGNQVLGVSHV
nr:GNAT family N-acetyltransferase [Lactococcus petauri]